MADKTLSRLMMEKGAIPLPQIPKIDQDYAADRMTDFIKHGRCRFARRRANAGATAAPEAHQPDTL